ncbi:hypothetical protein ASE95_10125 [Sphingomonas sp. Leaf231]|nr:hypothetical protein ASE95_10125 [Sphingomonas sp. Leaf231]
MPERFRDAARGSIEHIATPAMIAHFRPDASAVTSVRPGTAPARIVRPAGIRAVDREHVA